MAENAAHITSSFQAKPSIFEVIAQESLFELLHPSIKIVVQFLGSKNPLRYQWLNEWYEEVFLVVNGLLQLHYLNNTEASFSEAFYGLRRVTTDGENGRLSTKSKCWSLFCLVGLPYLALKVEQYTLKLQNLKVGEAVSLCQHSVVVGWRTVSLVQYLLYLTGHSTAHSPLLSIAHLSLQYRPEQPDTDYSWRDCLKSSEMLGRLVSDGLTQGLELGAFFLQCLQWWHSDETGHSKLTSDAPPPPPPATMPGVELSSSATCPVCKDPFKIETVVMTSGYVFCYRCVRDIVVAKQRCPVTGLPTTLDELVRLYPSK